MVKVNDLPENNHSQVTEVSLFADGTVAYLTVTNKDDCQLKLHTAAGQNDSEQASDALPSDTDHS